MIHKKYKHKLQTLITGMILLFIFGAVIFLRDQSEGLLGNQTAQVGNSLNNFLNCPGYQETDLLRNGGFEDGVPENTAFTLPNPYKKLCIWEGIYDYFSTQELPGSPSLLYPWPWTINLLSPENERMIRFGTVQHINAGYQSHEYIFQELQNNLIDGQTYNLSFSYETTSTFGTEGVGIAIAIVDEEDLSQFPQYYLTQQDTTLFYSFNLYDNQPNGDYANPAQFMSAMSQYIPSEKFIYISPNNEFMLQEDLDWRDFSTEFTFEDTPGSNEYLVMIPIGYAPDYAMLPGMAIKPAGLLFIDNVSFEEVAIDPVCALTYTGTLTESVYAVYGTDIVAINPGESINIANLTPYIPGSLNPLPSQGFLVSKLGNDLINIQSLNGESLTEEEVFSLFTIQNLSVSNFFTASGGSHYFNFECGGSCDLVGDLNENGIVDENDIEQIIASFGETCDECEEDVNEDSVVGIQDILIVTALIGTSCSSQEANQLTITPEITGTSYGIQSIPQTTQIGRFYNISQKISLPKRHSIQTMTVTNSIPTESTILKIISNQKNIVFNRKTNTLSIPSISGDTVQIYYDLTLSDHLCKTINDPKQILKENRLCR